MAIPLTAREPVEYTPPSLPERLKGPDPADPGKHKVRIRVRVATMIERDSYQAALVRGGVQHYTRQQIRDISLAGVQEIFPSDTAIEKQALLQELWAKKDEDAEVQALEIQILREEQEKAKAADRKIDLKEVKKRCAAEIQREVVMDHGREIEAQALAQEIVSRYGPLSQVVAGLADQDAKRAWLNIRLFVIGWTGLEHEPDPPRQGGLKEHETDYLRREIGSEAFGELSDFITAIMTIDEDEEKNLASLLADMSAPIGSTQPESTESSELGISTDGPSTTTPETASRRTTRSSSSSSTSSRAKASKRGRTGKRSSTSR